MTDLCLQNINMEAVMHLQPNKIQVPFTNGLTRTFENSLIAALIVVRDISPTLSVWEAFDLQKQVIVSFYNLSIAIRWHCKGEKGINSIHSLCKLLLAAAQWCEY